MKKIKVKELTVEAFRPYGSFCSVTDPKGFSLGDFFHDQILFNVSGDWPIAFSPCIIRKPDKMIVTSVEYHNSTAEAIVAMDDDLILHVAPPSQVPVPELTEAFYIPKGTAYMMNVGVWHNGAFAVHKDEAHVLILLPERIYKRDSFIVNYDEADQVEIEL